ncbi:hypothetical protein JXA80_12115, partial [bacterium]|nr:hypothetical protein [candidate division CSSED10-310 bacterium]
MDQSRNISVKASVLEGLQNHLMVPVDGNRFHLSHAVWQLARMGTVNEAGELPHAVRLEATGDFTELYDHRDRLVCPVDTADTDLAASDVLGDALVKCAVFLGRSRRRDMIDFSVLLSAKSAENLPERIADWTIASVLKDRLLTRLDALQGTQVLRDDVDRADLIQTVMDRLTVNHIRRRQGRLGEDALWGRELDAVKVLEDAGIDGSDLANALANLAFHAAGHYTNRKKAGIVFDRKDAVLMIRDYQRRARIQRAGVRVVDAMFLKHEIPGLQLTPRHPDWAFAVSHRMIRRDCFDAALRWARLAALKAGRGLLPVFFLTGPDGTGRSILLKQIAWELYKEGFAVAEILDINGAADAAEALATAAVSLDSPLILVWDDLRGPGLDPVPALREFAEAQLSGVPIMVLGASPDVGYNPRKIRQITRTSFEEFEVHSASSAERDRLGSDTPESLDIDPVRLGSFEPEEGDGHEPTEPSATGNPTDHTNATLPGHAAGDTDATTETGDAADEAATTKTGDPGTADATQTEPAGEVSEITRLQQQKTEEIAVFTASVEDEPTREVILEAAWVCRTGKPLADAAATAHSAVITALPPVTIPVYHMIRSFGLLGLPVPESLAAAVFGDSVIQAFRSGIASCAEPVLRAIPVDGETYWDCGHPLLVRAMVTHDQSGIDAVSDMLNQSLEHMIGTPALHPFAGRLIRAVHFSDAVPPRTVDDLIGTVIRQLADRTVSISPMLLTDLFHLALTLEHTDFQTAVVDALAVTARKRAVDSYIALTPLLRNRMGGLDDTETLDILTAAKPDIDRTAFKFLLKFLSDHLPNELRETAVNNARTAAARAPDEGFAVAAYLRLCWARGTETQIVRSIDETTSWLMATPEDRVVRREFLDYVVAQGSNELKTAMVEPVEDWLRDHMDEGPLRNSLIELVYSLNDPALSDRVLDATAEWIEKWGNNRSVRQNYFRRAEKRNDKNIMRRACRVAVSWLNTHPDDRETVRSLIYLASRVGEETTSVTALSAIYRWLNAHIVERDILRRYLILADRTGRGRAMTHAVELALKWMETNPDDREIREAVLGLAARRVDKKVQIQVYDMSAQWLDSLTSPDSMMEYLVGRLGVRAGIARRAIPLLERVAARESGELTLHARLWLGSAYRVAEAYDAALKVWEDVKAGGDADMADRADRNLQSLHTFMKEKFPDGFPPPEERRPPRRRRPVPQEIAGGEPGGHTPGDESGRPVREDRPVRGDRPVRSDDS